MSKVTKTIVVNTPKPKGKKGKPKKEKKAQIVIVTPKKAKKVIKQKLRGVVSNINGGMLAKKIAAAICLPGTCPNLRLRESAFDSNYTAVDSLHSLLSIKQPTNLGTYTSMPVGNSFVALFKDPLRSAIVFQPNPNTGSVAQVYSYVGYFRNGANVNSYYSNINTNATGEVELFEPLYFVSGGAWAPHGTRLYPGSVAGGNLYFWVDYNATVTVVQSSADTSADAIFYIWSGKDELVSSLKFSTTTVTFTQALTSGGYIRVAYLSNNATPVATNLTVTITGSGDVFAHLAVPNVESHYNQLTKTRVNAASILISPIASVLNENGTLSGGFIENAKPWYNYTNSTSVLSLPIGFFDEWSFKLGMYAFVKPSDIAEYSYHEYCTYDASGLSKSAFNLESPSRYLVMCGSVDVQSAAALGLEFLLTLNWDLEYQSTDQWFETHKAGSTAYDTMNAVEIVSGIPIFHENPLHWKDITGAIAGGFNFVKKHATKFAKAFSIFMPHLAGPAHLASSFMNSLPEM